MKYWPLIIIAGIIAIAPAMTQERISFTSNRTGAPDVFVISPDGTGQVNTTNTSGINEEFLSLINDITVAEGTNATFTISLTS